MKEIFVVVLLFCSLVLADNPVLKNPGIPKFERLKAWDYINKKVGFVPGDITIKETTVDGKKYYVVNSTEGKYFRNVITLNYDTLAPISDERYDSQANTLIEAWYRLPKSMIRFYQKAKNIDLKQNDSNQNVYSRYAFFVSLRGFPFCKKDQVSFQTYMYEYGNFLSLKAVNLGKEKITVKAGTFECYKIELCVDSWQGIVANDKYYLYFTVDGTHQFMRFDQKVEDGKWLSNELMFYSLK